MNAAVEDGALRRTWPLWLLLAAVWVATLQVRPLIDPDEGRYAEIPREMWVSGDWIVPHLNGLAYFEKPPLQYWATAGLYTLFGPHEWTARLWAVLLAFACIPMVFAFAQRIGYGRRTAIVSALVLAVSPYFAIVGQITLLDQAFTFFITATLFAFVLAQREADRSPAGRNYMLLAWAALALAVLSKGVVAIALIGTTLAVYAALTRSIGFLRRMRWGIGVPLFAVIAVPWFLAVQHAQPQFAQFFFIHEHLQRFLTTIHDHVEPWWFFVPILVFAWLPVIWSSRAAVTTNWKSDAVPGGLQVGKLLLVWSAVVLVFFSLSQSKLAPYILPMMPALAVLFGRVAGNEPRSADRALLVVAPLICVAALGMMIYGFDKAHMITALAAWGIAAILIALLGVAGCRLVRSARRVPAMQAMTAAWVVLSVTSIAGFQALYGAYNHLPRTRTARELAREVSGSVGPGTSLFTVGHYRQSMGFYLGRTLEVFDYRGELEFGLGLAQGDRKNDVAAFRRRWEATPDGIAFIDPRSWPALLAQGMPGRVIASDERSVAVSRR